MLLWAGLELIPSPEAVLGLCFGFVLHTGLVMQMFLLLSRDCTEPFPAPHTGHSGEGLGGTEPGQVITTDPRDIPDLRTPCSVIKWGKCK